MAATVSQDVPARAPQRNPIAIQSEGADRKIQRPAQRRIDKVGPGLRAALAGSERQRVVLVLNDQPQAEIYGRVLLRQREAIDRAERVLRTASIENGDPAVRTEALATLDEITLQARRETALALERQTGVVRREVTELLQSLGATDVDRFELMNAMRATIPASALARLEIDDRIAEIGLVEQLEAQLDVSAPWLGAPAVWTAGFTGTGESVVVLDSGVAATHAAFTGRVVSSSFVDRNPTCSAEDKASSSDFNGHGTHVAGIIASAGTTASPAYKGVAQGLGTLYNAKVSCAAGLSFTDDILQAVNRALVNTPSSIINNSNGGQTSSDDDFFSRQIDLLADTYNLIWINAAGNRGAEGARTIESPGTAYNILSVGSVDTKRALDRTLATVAASSSRGPTIGDRAKPDISAPGQNITSVDFAGTGFVAKSGTSMAAPHVAGAAALLRQAGVRDRLQMKALLLNTTGSDGWDPGSGWGYLDLSRALTERQHLLSGSVGPQRFDATLYRLNAEPGKRTIVTLAWNRYLGGGTSFLRDLDLSAFVRATSELIAVSYSEVDNVEQIEFTNPFAAAVDLIIRVEGFNDGMTGGQALREPYALAISTAGLQQIQGPRVTIQCTPPTSAAAGQSFTFDCTFRNSGDLPTLAGFGVLLSGTRELQRINMGPLAIGSLVTRTFTVPASPAGPLPLSVAFGGSGYDVFPTPYAFTVTVTGTSTLPGITEVTHGASFLPEISESTWITIKGSNLSTGTRTWAAADFVNGMLPVALDGVSVKVNGRAAFVYYISPTQINALAPNDVATGNIAVQVTNASGITPDFQVRKIAMSPAFFTFSAGGKTYAAAVHPDGYYVAPRGAFGASVASRPAKPGDTIQIFGSGCGASSPALPADRVVAAPAPLVSTASITVGGMDAAVQYAGIVGSGLCQFNITVPQALPGDQPLTLTVGRVLSTFETRIPVEAP